METGDLDAWTPWTSRVWQGTRGEGMRTPPFLPQSCFVLPLSPRPQSTPIFQTVSVLSKASGELPPSV